MENLLNIFHYCIFLMDKKLHYLSNKVNPLLFIFKIPFFKKVAEKNNEDLFEVYNTTFTDKANGFNIWVAGGILISVIFGILISTFTFICRVLSLYEYVPKFYYILCLGISIFIGYFYIFKKDKYLYYFKQYEMWSKSQKRKYILISFLLIIATIAYFFMSLLCC